MFRVVVYQLYLVSRRLLPMFAGIQYSLAILQWRHNERDGVPNQQPYDCLLNRLFRPRSKKTPKLRVTDLCEGNSPGTGEFPTQRASNAENVSIWWRHHEVFILFLLPAQCTIADEFCSSCDSKDESKCADCKGKYFPNKAGKCKGRMSRYYNHCCSLHSKSCVKWTHLWTHFRNIYI